ncbi:MAG: class I SAM-dependent methyltransferase [Candidatus Micrarchaeota archaeon]
MVHSKIIESHFNSIENYVYMAEKVVPFNKELHDKVIGELSIWAPEEFTFVDLGLGGGEIDEKILDKFPKSRFIGVDISEKMLSLARKRLARFGERVHLEKGDFVYIDFGMENDFVISELAIHNSTDDEKAKLFQNISDSLTDKGIFINADFIAGEDPIENERDKKWYLNFLQENLQGEELEAWVRHAFYEDNPSKLSDQYKLLEEAGFKKVEVTWKKMNLAVYVAYK